MHPGDCGPRVQEARADGEDGGGCERIALDVSPDSSMEALRRSARIAHGSSVVTDQMDCLERTRLFLPVFKLQERDSRAATVLREGSAHRREHERTLMGTEGSRPHETSVPHNGGSETRAAAAACQPSRA